MPIEPRCFGPQNRSEEILTNWIFRKLKDTPVSDIRSKKILKPLDINLQWRLVKSVM
jgi:hypothetical protein